MWLRNTVNGGVFLLETKKVTAHSSPPSPRNNDDMATKMEEIPLKGEMIKIRHILETPHEIPYHSRPFSWTLKKYIEHATLKLVRAWQERKKSWLGTILIYTGGDHGCEHPSISDGQHRITLCFLMWLALSQLLEMPKMLDMISVSGGEEDDLVSDVPESTRTVLEKYGWDRMPNIVSCYEEDLEALGNLVNGKTPAVGTHDSKLYAAFASVKKLLETQLPDKESRRDFALYIREHIQVMCIASDDPDFIIQVFIELNNIKVLVPPSYLLKNAFASVMGVSHIAEIHAVFCELMRKKTTGDKDPEQFIHAVTNMYRRSLIPFKDYESAVSTLVKPTADGSSPLAQFCTVAARLEAVTDHLQKDPYGRILLTGLSRGCEVLNLCLRPLGFVALETGDLASFQAALRALCAFAIRRQAPVSFNPQAYQEALYALMNRLLGGEVSLRDTVTALRAQLVAWLGATSSAAVVEGVRSASYMKKPDFQRARAMLLFVVLKTDSHEMTLDPDATQIDHIFPRKPRATDTPLAEKSNCHRLGNFTPLVGKNSTGGMKGNCALGNKPFAEKVPHYGTSNLKMTRDVATLFATSGFRDPEIEVRSGMLAELITAVTAAELEL